MLLSRHQIAGQNLEIRIANFLFLAAGECVEDEPYASKVAYCTLVSLEGVVFTCRSSHSLGNRDCFVFVMLRVL
jgi:hypothetical protein